MSSSASLPRSSTLGVTGMGAVSISTGSSAASANAWNRARGVSPSLLAASSLATSTAAAPSVIWEEFPAVTTPSGLNAGLSPASRSSVVSRRTPSSTTSRSPPSSVAEMPTISRSNRPSSMARAARSCERRANASSSSRDRPHCSAIISADSPCGTRPGNRSCMRGPNGSLPGSMDAPIGTLVMFSTPAAITMSYAPASTPCAAKCSACCDDPHCRSTDVPGTDSGNPAASRAFRPMLTPCSPTCDTHPMITSSTSAGSTSLRSTTARSTCAARSTGCHSLSIPLRRPSGVRTASMITASVMSVTYRHMAGPTPPTVAPGPLSKRIRFGWVLEVVGVAAFYQLYDRARDWVMGTRVDAFRNARLVTRIEVWLGIYHEKSIQRFFLDYPFLVTLWNSYYGTAHFALPLFAGIYLYVRFPERYVRWRNTFLFILVLGPIGWLFFPLTPPKYLPERYGFVDTPAEYFNFGPQRPV